MTDGDARDRLVLVLDVGGLDEARRLAERLSPWFATVKVGYELYAEAGPAAFDVLHDLGLRVFADLKLYDIPNTVARGARAGHRGVEFLNFHAAGGVPMLRAGVEALREGAREGGHDQPVALGVTVLTSEANTDAFEERLGWSREAGCEGVVCSAFEATRRTAPDSNRWSSESDSPAVMFTTKRELRHLTTPSRKGASWLGIGRAVTTAVDPEAAAAEVHTLVEGALQRSN